MSTMSSSRRDTVDRSKNETRSEPASEDEKYYWPNCEATIWLRSCEHEVIEPIEAKYTGTIPEWLRGTLLRNGPGSLKVGEYKFDHLFDSSALLHKFEIRDGTITYQRRFVGTNSYKRNQAARRIVQTEFGTKAVPDPCQSIFQRVSSFFSVPEMSDNSMISVYPFGDEFYTFTEAPYIHRIDPDTLDTISRVELSRYVGIVNHTSHPHVMPDGTVYNLGLTVTTRGPAYAVICFPPSQKIIDQSGNEKKVSTFDQARVVATVPARWKLNPSYMHTFGITDNYFVIIEQPLSVNVVRIATSCIVNEPFVSSLQWFDNQKTLIHVLRRDTGKIKRTFVAEAFFYLHIINQFETKDGESIVLDICCYKDARLLNCMYVEKLKNMHADPDYANTFRGRPLRFVLPLESDVAETPNCFLRKYWSNLFENDAVTEELESTENLNATIDGCRNTLGDHERVEKLLRRPSTAHRLSNDSIFVKPELLCDLGCETPRINTDRHLGKEYRYFYAISSDVEMDNPGTMIKVDTATKTRKTWCEHQAFPSEPIFVRNPDSKSEDDGVVVSAVIWGGRRENEISLLVLDAITFQEIARATFITPGPVPKCLHGWFQPKR